MKPAPSSVFGAFVVAAAAFIVAALMPVACRAAQAGGGTQGVHVLHTPRPTPRPTPNPELPAPSDPHSRRIRTTACAMATAEASARGCRLARRSTGMVVEMQRQELCRYGRLLSEARWRWWRR